MRERSEPTEAARRKQKPDWPATKHQRNEAGPHRTELPKESCPRTKPQNTDDPQGNNEGGA